MQEGHCLSILILVSIASHLDGQSWTGPWGLWLFALRWILGRNCPGWGSQLVSGDCLLHSVPAVGQFWRKQKTAEDLKKRKWVEILHWQKINWKWSEGLSGQKNLVVPILPTFNPFSIATHLTYSWQCDRDLPWYAMINICPKYKSNGEPKILQVYTLSSDWYKFI